ncbi:hypothetical protein VNO77_30671 [Canavalia gladiata]|uniref:Uncharacterized protein n=1 Tax=Canavalia gladiata TaxID=3824 RepID=A0AAN9KNN1_CANGL
MALAAPVLRLGCLLHPVTASSYVKVLMTLALTIALYNICVGRWLSSPALVSPQKWDSLGKLRPIAAANTITKPGLNLIDPRLNSWQPGPVVEFDSCCEPHCGCIYADKVCTYSIIYRCEALRDLHDGPICKRKLLQPNDLTPLFLDLAISLICNWPVALTRVGNEFPKSDNFKDHLSKCLPDNCKGTSELSPNHYGLKLFILSILSRYKESIPLSVRTINISLAKEGNNYEEIRPELMNDDVDVEVLIKSSQDKDADGGEVEVLMLRMVMFLLVNMEMMRLVRHMMVFLSLWLVLMKGITWLLRLKGLVIMMFFFYLERVGGEEDDEVVGEVQRVGAKDDDDMVAKRGGSDGDDMVMVVGGDGPSSEGVASAEFEASEDSEFGQATEMMDISLKCIVGQQNLLLTQESKAALIDFES